MTTKKEQSEALESLKTHLSDCRRLGKSSLRISWVGGMPTNTGRSDYFTLEVFGTDTDGRPVVTGWLNRLFTAATSYRLNPKREAITVTGCGYSKAHHIAHELARMVGHDIHVQGEWSGWATKR